MRDLAPAGRDDVALSKPRAFAPGVARIRGTLHLAPDCRPPRGRDPRLQCYHAAEETMATTTRRVATEDDLLAMPKDGQKYELVDGEIRMSAAGDLPDRRRSRPAGPGLR